MKNFCTTFLAYALYMGIAFSQNAATPNAGFENWTAATSYNTPNNWNTLNSTTSYLSVYTCLKATAASDYHSGTAAIELITKTVLTSKAQGIATTGKLNTNMITMTGSINGGIPYTERPDSIVGWYKSSPVSNDTGFVQFILFGSTRDTIGIARFYVPATAVTKFTRFHKAIEYRSSNVPDSSLWILSSSSGATGQQVNSTIWVDDLDLIYNTTGISNTSSIDNTVILFGNPVSDKLDIYIPQNSQIEILNINGQILKNIQDAYDCTIIDFSDLAKGLYFIEIKNKDGILVKKIIKD